MSGDGPPGFLQRLVSRTRAQDAPVRPHLASRFEPVTDPADAIADAVESTAPARAATVQEERAVAIDVRPALPSETLVRKNSAAKSNAVGEPRPTSTPTPEWAREAAPAPAPSAVLAKPPPDAGEVERVIAEPPVTASVDLVIPKSERITFSTNDSPRPAMHRATTHAAALVPARQPAMFAETHGAPVAPRRSIGRFDAIDVGPPATPDVHVTIGRLEVRATPAPRSVRTSDTPPRRTMGLEDYLRERGGKR